MRAILTGGNLTKDKQGCGYNGQGSGQTCRTCVEGVLLPYWCETCQQPVPEKRCPDCGLKCRKTGRI